MNTSFRRLTICIFLVVAMNHAIIAQSSSVRLSKRGISDLSNKCAKKVQEPVIKIDNLKMDPEEVSGGDPYKIKISGEITKRVERLIVKPRFSIGSIPIPGLSEPFDACEILHNYQETNRFVVHTYLNSEYFSNMPVKFPLQPVKITWPRTEKNY